MDNAQKDISVKELHKMQADWILKSMKAADSARAKNDWERLIDITLNRHEIIEPVFKEYFQDIPDILKYDFIVSAYTHHGDSTPIVRKYVRKLRSYGNPILPEEIADKEIITVYRAGEEPINMCKYRLSWTLDKDVAVFFYNKYIHKHASYLYKAELKVKDILAYTNEKNEKEVLQYRNVHNVELIDKK